MELTSYGQTPYQLKLPDVFEATLKALLQRSPPPKRKAAKKGRKR